MSFAHPLTAMLIPLIGAIGIVAAGKKPNIREGITLVTSLALFVCVCSMLPIVFAADYSVATAASTSLIQVIPGMHLAFKIEPLGMVYAMIAATLWPLNSLYSIGYMRGNNEKHQTRFYLCFALALSAVMGIAFADNMFTLFIFYEALTLSTFPLVSHKGTPDAVRSARTYLGILVTSSICFLLSGMIGAYICSGVLVGDQYQQTLDFTIGGIFQREIDPFTIGILFALHIYGIGKCAIMPLHRWLPAAMVAPTPVSALLHAVAVVKAGVFSVVKVVVYIFGVDTLAAIGWADWLIYMAGFTIVCGSFIALFQDNLKRRLAYSTISQLSYIVLGAGMFNAVGIVGAGMHIAAHAFGKITLFFAAGSIYTAAHKTKVSELDGIGRRMPWTMAAFTVGTLSMIGLPLTGGIVSKWYLLQGALERQSAFIITVLILSTLLNACYFLPIVYRAFFKSEAPPAHDGHGHDAHDHGEAPWPIVVALSCTALFTVVLFFYPNLYLNLMEVVRASLGGGA